MYKTQFCQKFFEEALPNMHKKQRDCLTRLVSGLLTDTRKLTVTEVGRAIESGTTMKHNIKAADRWFSNRKIENQMVDIYQGIAHCLYRKMDELFVAVDWSGACGSKRYLLQASVIAHGRSIPVYNDVFEEKAYQKEKTHLAFLSALSEVLPSNKKITIITDAGFHRSWFDGVIKQGWDCMGRISGKYQYKEEDSKEWKECKEITCKKRGVAKKIGAIKLGKTGKRLGGYLYSYHGEASGRTRKKNKYPDHEKQYKKSHDTPWVLFSSKEVTAEESVFIYEKRMQIEQNFRDIKSKEYGMSLRSNKSYKTHRLRMLNFLGSLVTILWWWIGVMGEMEGKQKEYQANTRKDRRIVSLVHLGYLMCRKETMLYWQKFVKALKRFWDDYRGFLSRGCFE